MTLHISISPQVEARLRECAAVTGQDISEYAAGVLDQALGKPTLEEILAPVRRAFEKSGMSEDELTELLENEKHSMRAGQ